MALSRIGLVELEEGSKTGSISVGIKSGTLKGVTKESIPAEEEGVTTSSQEGKKFGTLYETDAKGKDCSWKITSLERKTL